MADPRPPSYFPTVTDDAITRLNAALAGRYAVDREQGHGGMATVYLARDLKHARQVAIKVLRPDLAQAVGAERFLREINIAAQLQSPHILPLLDSGAADDLLFYVMPYVDGDSLRSLLTRSGALPPSDSMRLLRDIVDGVAHAHRRGVVHRDLKPDNVMIAERHALVVDFGVAKAMREASSQHGLTSVGISLGTPAYMAPEQAAADPNVDHRADIYALGVVAYELLTGKAPFTGSPQNILAAHITQPVPPLSTVAPQVPAAIAALVMKCLEKDPANRYQTADELLQAIESLSTPSAAYTGATAAPAAPAKKSSWRAIGIAAGVIGVAGVAYAATASSRRMAWVRDEAIPTIARQLDGGQPDSAFAIALRVRELAPTDTAFARLWDRLTLPLPIVTDPPGVHVTRAGLGDTTLWYDLGTSPVDSVRVVRRAGYYRFAKAGYRTLTLLYGPAAGQLRPLKLIPLDAESSPNPEMVRIPAGTFSAFLVGTETAPEIALAEYRMDRYEVRNADYQKFVDAGGYKDAKWWTDPVVEGGKTLAFDAAVARFVDKTGRPGPSAWEGGGFPQGQGDYPVGGVSWYEARAYARFAGKALPTVYHWSRAATSQYSRFVVPRSNLEGKGPLPVGTPRGISRGGVSDLAGNVREWCINDAGQGERFILGGGWSDQPYGFVDAYAQPPMDRNPINGIRLVLYDSVDANVAKASAPVTRAFTDYTKVKPATDAEFAGYRQQFDYDPRPLDAKVEARDTTVDAMTVEYLTFSAAYGKERMGAWVYAPKVGKGPFQTVVYFPGSGVIGARSSQKTREDFLATMLVRSGRIFVLPIYKSTYERGDSLTVDIPDNSIFWRDHVVMWGMDYRRTLDYLSSRDDVDAGKFAYFGTSWGGANGAIIPAIEPRLKAAVLYIAGLTMERSRPETDAINFLPRVKLPVIMLNGKYDFFFPLTTSQEPFFKNLGTPAADKKRKVYEGGHDVPRAELFRETLAWLDKYLGPVK